MKRAALVVATLFAAACCPTQAAAPAVPVENTAPAPAPVEVTPTPTTPATPEPAALMIPSRIKGRYALAATSAHNAPLPADARVFVTLDASGAAYAGTIGKDALDAGALVGMPKQVTFHTDDTSAGTPRLRDTVAALLGAGEPAPVLDDTSRHEILTSGCTHWPPGEPRAVSWGRSKDQLFEVLAFARVADPSAAHTVIVADAAAPAIRLIQAADDVPVARIAVDSGRDAAVGLALDLGGAVALGDPVCIGSNRSLEVTGTSIDVNGDGIKYKTFGTIPVSGAAFTFDRAALVTAFKAQLAAKDLGDRHVVVHVRHGVPVAELVAVLDALVEAGGTAFILHVYPDMMRPVRVRTRQPLPPKKP